MGDDERKAPETEAFPPLAVVAARFGTAIWQMAQFQREALSAFEKSAELSSGIVAAVGAALRDEPPPARSEVDEADLVDVELRRDEAETVLERSELMYAHNTGHFPQMLGEMCLVALFARYDAFISDLLVCVFRRRPELLKSGKQISFEDVLEAGSLDDLKDELVDREVEGWRKPMRAQLDAIKQRFGVRIALPDHEISTLVDAAERRHAIVHRGGRVDSRYLREVPDSTFPEGSILTIDNDYVEEMSGVLVRLVFNIATEISAHCLSQPFEVTDELIEASD